MSKLDCSCQYFNFLLLFFDRWKNLHQCKASTNEMLFLTIVAVCNASWNIPFLFASSCFWFVFELYFCRPVYCKFKRIGCLWGGPFHKLRDHEEKCVHPGMTGFQLMESLETTEKLHQDEKELFQNILNLLSYEKIAING